MPTSFTVHGDEGYYLARITGAITNESLLADYRAFLSGPEWRPGLNELVDLGDADLGQITPVGLVELARMVEGAVSAHPEPVKVAVYAPRDLPYGLARVYSVQAESFERNQVFRDLDEARSWLTSQD